MVERDTSARLRKAVRGSFLTKVPSYHADIHVENNRFLVERLIKRIDIRNPDPGPKRYTSLAWAAVEGNEEMFEYLLGEGHDDNELSRV